MVLVEKRPMLELLSNIGDLKILGRECVAVEFSESVPREAPGARGTATIRESAARAGVR